MDKGKIVSFLKGIDDLKAVPEEQLAWLVDKSEVIHLSKGDSLFKPGGAIEQLYIVLEGSFRMYIVRESGGQREFDGFEKGYITGALPFSRAKNAIGYADATVDSKVLKFPKKYLREMIGSQYELTEAFVHFMSSRIRSFTKREQQEDRLISLGKLSAGLSHELNNPVSAIARSADALQQHLKLVPDNFKRVININLTDEQVDCVNALLFSKIDNYKPHNLSLSERSELEDELADYLEEEGVEDGYELADNLVEFGFSLKEVEGIREVMSKPEDFIAVMGWVDSNLTTEKMVSEIGESSKRISGLVQAVKSYTHMDQSQDKQEVWVHEGLRSTVAILQHKIKKANVSIVEDFPKQPICFQGFPGKVNQIWTNIIDNAIDALQESKVKNPTIQLHAREENGFVKIDIEDNGPGIPGELLDKVFDPFYTTKPIGKGTGMGLDLVNQLINQHRGDIRVKSEPGQTVFSLCFPKEG